MSSESLITQSSYNVALIDTPSERLTSFPSQSERSLLDDYEPSLKPLALSGLAALHWAGRQNPDLLDTPVLNDISHPPIHPDFTRQVATLGKEASTAAQAGAAVLAVTSADQAWMRSADARVETISTAESQYGTTVAQRIRTLDAQKAAGSILYSPHGWNITDLSAQHSVRNGKVGLLRLSATLMEGSDAECLAAGRLERTAKQYYFLNLFTSFNDSRVAGRPHWATAKTEAGTIDCQRFASIETAGFDRFVKLAQVLNSLMMGEGYLANVPWSD